MTTTSVPPVQAPPTPTTTAAPATQPAGQLPGWTPAGVQAVPSVRKAGMLPAAFDALRGVDELGNGQALSPVQVAALSPYLSASFKLNPVRVAQDLSKVRVYTGGPAAGMPWWAVTLGRDIYVNGETELKAMFDWGQRRWLAHELGHTMQWRRTGDDDTTTDLSRMRRSMGKYVGGMALDDRLHPGAVPRGLALWFRENIDPRNHNKSHISLSNAVHDTHHLEREAELHAQGFERLTNLPPKPGPSGPATPDPVAP